MNCYITTHRFIPKSRVPVEDVKETFTAVSKYGGPGIPYYHETGTHIGVPLYSSYGMNLPYEDLRLAGGDTTWDFTSALRPKQSLMINEFKQELLDGKEGFIVDSPAGSGKTVTALKMLEILRRTALVVVPKTDLVNQWVERALQHTNIPREKIGIATNGKIDCIEGKELFVGLIHTLNLDRFGDEFKKMFGVIVFDEVDRSMPPATFAPVIKLFPARYRLGLSATTTRKDGLHTILDAHLGQCRIYGKDEGRMKPTVLIHRYTGSSGTLFPGMKKLNKRGMLITKLASNPERNQLITSYINSIYQSDRRVIVISDRTEQLSLLREVVHQKYKIPKEEMGFYARSITRFDKTKKSLSDKDRKNTADNAKILLATYGMMKMGTDIPDVAAMIFATPQADIIQTKGRIERMVAGKQAPVVVDIVDTHYPETIGWGNARKKQYLQSQLVMKERTT